MGFLKDVTRLVGETARMNRTAGQEEQLDPETRRLLELLKQNARNGDVQAMFDLGNLYNEGKYVAYDPEQACTCWTEAGKNGHVDAQYNLGLLYHGSISSYYYDPDLAGMWFNMAANNGDQEARKMLQYYRWSSFRKKWIRE